MQTKHAEIQDAKTRRWAEGLRIGLAIAEGADLLDDADRVQILDAKGKVLFTASLRSSQ